ncbi:MAG: DUF3486 family protein [Gammaproteobacteria bacterium]|nr:DUF3486 family protein [Gammaproteobacteria bacterium]
MSEFDRFFSQAEQLKLAAYLYDHPAITVDDFRDLLAQRGLEVGRSTAGREKARLAATGRIMRDSGRDMEAIFEQIRDGDESMHNRALLEMFKTLLFKAQLRRLENPDEPPDEREIALYARSFHDVMKAARFAQDFDAKEKSIRADEKKKNAEEVQEAARKHGASPELMEWLDQKFMSDEAKG